MIEFHSRNPRFKRAHDAPNFRLTPRDVEIIRHVTRYRFLRSTHLAALTGASQQAISRRLNLLFHHGHLTRPPEQLSLSRLLGNQPMVYSPIGRTAGVHFIEHALEVSDFMVALECACAKQPGIRFIDQYEIISVAPLSIRKSRNPLYWRVMLYDHGKKHRLGVIPDRLFGIEIKNASGLSKIGYFFLEADRGTMPITRQSFHQTSISRKLLAYTETWRQGIHQRQLGIPRFRVVFVTSQTERAERIIAACRRTSGNNLFLVVNQAKFNKNNSSMESLFHTSYGPPERLCDGI
jgi:hypothetical protein